MNVTLVMVNAEGTSREFPVPSFPSVMGRDKTCKIRIPLSAVSRSHCELDIDDEELVVRDTNSSNGTYVNGERVRERELIPGDLLSIGPIVFVVRIDGHPHEIDSRDCYAAGAIAQPADSNDGVPSWGPSSADTGSGEDADPAANAGLGSLVGDDEDSGFDFDLDLDDDDN